MIYNTLNCLHTLKGSYVVSAKPYHYYSLAHRHTHMHIHPQRRPTAFYYSKYFAVLPLVHTGIYVTDVTIMQMCNVNSKEGPAIHRQTTLLST